MRFYNKIGVAGFFAEFFSKLPSDTEVILGSEYDDLGRELPHSLEVHVGGEVRNVINADKNGKISSKVYIPLYVFRSKEYGMKSILEDFLNALLWRNCDYDRRKLPKVETLAKTIANNPCAFLDALSEFQKKYKRNKEVHDEQDVE